MTDPLQTLQGDLNILATADTHDPQNGTAAAQPALTAAGLVLSLLADQSLVGSTIAPAVSSAYGGSATVINDDVVQALQKIALELSTLDLGGASLSEVASALSALQNALQTAQSLVPGGSSAAASALASTSQFATLFGNLLQDAGTLLAAADTLYEIAQQLAAVAATLKTAAQGNP
jgi:hypothetical protein